MIFGNGPPCKPEGAPDSWYLVRGTFLPPNRSISNITGSYFGYPGLLTFRVFFEFKKSGNHLNEVKKSRNVFFLKKKPPAGLHHTDHRVGMQQQIVLPEFKYPDIQIFHLFRPACMGPFSENHTFTWGALRRNRAGVPKIIPMQAGRDLRGPSFFVPRSCFQTDTIYGKLPRLHSSHQFRYSKLLNNPSGRMEFMDLWSFDPGPKTILLNL